MSAVAVEQVTADEFIFGDHQLHARFFTAIELLAQIVIATPRPVSAPTLAEAVGQPLRVVRALLQSLGKSDLVRADAKVKDAWFCAGSLNAITLADIFRCVSASMIDSASTRKRKCDAAIVGSSRSSTQQSVDLLLMQATMAVNQVVLQHLQQFDLGRLRAVASTVPFRMLNARPAAYGAEPC